MADTPAWLSEYPEVQDDSWLNQYKEVGEKPFLDLSETASSLGRAVTSLPTTTMASLSQAWEGLENPWKRSEGYLSRRQEMQALQDELAASEAEAAASGDASTVSSAIRAATPSLGFSGATLLPSIGAGAGTLALSRSPAAARGAAAATSALMAYRMAGAQFLDDAKDRIDAYFQENVGRAPNEQEQAEAYQELLPLARKFGAAEAGPEALGNLALGGAGKYIRRALGGKGGIIDLASNALGKVTGTKAALAGAGALASEVGTEAVTGVEQSRIQKQFEEGIMRGESPESVALAERSLGDYTSAIEEVAPATIATVGMMGAAGLGPKAISRGIQALRPKPPVEQIVEEPSMPDPAEVAKTIGDASVEQLAATGNEASAAAQADFNAILAEKLGKAPEPTIQPEQAAEKVGAEVTPLSEGAERVVTPEEESLAAKRRADLLSAAADVAKGKTKAQVSPAVTAMVTPQPVETQEDATREIPLEESFRQEPQDRVESREAEETGAGDQLLRPAEGEVEGEVITPPGEPTTATEARQTQEEVVLTPQVREQAKDVYNSISGTRAGQALTQAAEGVVVGMPTSVDELYDNDRLESSGWPSFVEESKKAADDLYSSYEGVRESLRKQFGPTIRLFRYQGTGEEARTFVGSKKTLNWASTESEARQYKGKNRTLRVKEVPIEDIVAVNVGPKGNYEEFVVFNQEANPDFPPSYKIKKKPKSATNQDFYKPKKGKDFKFDGTYEVLTPSGIRRIFKDDETGAWMDADEKSPVFSPLPFKFLGYTKSEAIESLKKEQPQTKQAAETQTPVPLREGTGAAGVVQSEPVEGSIPTVEKVSTETESESSEKLDPKLVEAERKQAKEEEAAAKKQEKLEQDTKSSLNSVVGPQKKNDIQGTVTKADVEAARAALTNSGEIPNAYLTNVYESREAFLADRVNERLFPATYARLKNEDGIEGLFSDGKTFVFAKDVFVSDLDRNLAKILGVSDEQAAARRVIIHESGHDAISRFLMAEKRELRGYLMRAYSDEQIAKLVEKYTEYADWRTNPESRLEALEELLMRDFEKMERIPTGGVWDDIVQFLKRVWRRLTGQKGEPTLKNLKDVVRLMRNAMKRPEVPLGSFRLKDGGEVKLSMIAPTAGITPEMDAEYLTAVESGDMEKAQRMVDEAAANAGYDRMLFHQTHKDTVPKIYESGFRLDILGARASDNEMPDGIFLKPDESNIKVGAANAEDIRQMRLFVRLQNPLIFNNRKELVQFVSAKNPAFSATQAEFTKTDKAIVSEVDRLEADALSKPAGKEQDDAWERYFNESDVIFEKGRRSLNEIAARARAISTAAVRASADGIIVYDDAGSFGRTTTTVVALDPNQIKSADPVTRDDSGNVIPLSQRFQTTSPDIRFSRPQFSSDTSAAFSAGSEAARSTLYSERDMDIREAIRRAYEAMPKTNSVAVPIGDLFAKTEELMPGVTQDEFSNVLQDLFEDNGAVLQEGDVVESSPGGLSEAEARNPMTIYRAGDADEVGVKPFSSWTPERETAEEYQDNPGFGGKTLRELRVDAGNVLEADTTSRRGMRALAEALEFEAETGDDWFDNGWRYPWEESSKVKRALEDSDFDAVQYTDDFPAGATTIIFTRQPQQIVKPSSESSRAAGGISEINVTTPEGRRAGFVVVMPRAAKASRIKAEDVADAAKTFQSDIIEAGKGRIDTASYQGNTLKSTEAPDHNENAPELYRDAAISLVDSLLKKHSITDIANSFQDPDLRVAFGLLGNKAINPNVAQQAELFTGAEIQNRLENSFNKERNPAKKRIIEKTLKNHKAYYTTATGIGQNLNAVGALQQDPRFKWMFIFNEAEKEMADKAKEKLDTITGGGTQPVTDTVNQSEEAAADEATKQIEESVEEDEDAALFAEGEASLQGEAKSIWERMKDILRKIAFLDRLDKRDASSAKASLSEADKNTLSSLPKEERAKKRAEFVAEFIALGKIFMGEGKASDTPAQKATRQKRKKMVDTAKKRAEAGKEIEVTRIQIQSFMDELMPGYTERKSIVNEVGDALLKAAEQRKAKPRQRTAIQDFVSAIKQTLMANIRGDKISAEQPSLGMLLAKTFAQQGSEAEAFAAAWANGRKKVRGMLAEMGVEEGNLDAELDAIMPPTPTLAYAPAAARKAISSAMRESGLMRSDLLNDPAASKKAIMEKFDEAAKSANLTEEGWDKKGRALAEKAVDESIAEAKMAQERAKKVAKILSEQAEKPVSLEDFGAKLAEFRFKKDKIAELFNRAKKLAERKIQMANDQAIRVLLAAENKLAQSAFFNAAEKPDTIVKAFREQVEEPMERDAFKKRMEKMLVTPEMADKLFDRAARERDNARWKKAQDLLEGPNALQNLLRQMNMARPGEQAPFSKQIPWREILSQKAKTVEEYRQRIFDAILANEAFQNLSDEQKGRLSDLFSEAWESKRTDILDRMLEREIDRKRREGSLSEAAAKALQKSRNKIIELANLGGFDNDDLMKVLGEKFGIKTGFSEAEKARISELADKLQDETLNPAKRNKLAMEFAVTLAGASEIPVSEIIANWWTSSVLFGPQTIFSIGAAFVNGAYSITTIGTRRMLADLTRGDVKGAIEESILMLQGIAKYLGAFKQAGRRAWSYLWTGNVDVLGAAANDILGEINSLEELKRFKRHKLLAENLAKDPRALRRYVGMYLRFVNRLLTSLDAFNVMVTKAGTASLALRMSGMSTDNIIKAEKMLNLKAYKDQVIRNYFDNKAPTTQAEKALVDSYAEAEMYRAVDQLGGKMENADYLASESAMTMNPTGLGGFFYRSITGLDNKMKKAAEDYLEKAKKDWTTEKDLESTLFLGLAYLRQFAVQNLGGVAGYKFIRFASNKFNQGISYLPMVGLLRTLEAKGDDIKGKEAFIETIHRNQVIGAVLTLAAIAVVKALEDEPDDEERGNFWNGGWQNLTPDQKKQMLAKGQKEYTMGFKFNGRWYVFNYQNWPLNQVLAAIGSMSDQIRFSPKQWEEKGPLSKSLAGIVSGLKSTLEIPALSQLGTLVGNRLASKDPTEQTVDRLSNVAAGWVGGFVPRILKDLDFATQPELRKYKTLWEKTASHIPIYRRYVGEDYYDILGQPIKRNVIPGSREFMMGPTEPEYKILGALNSRNIFLTPANAEYRMVGKGRNRRRLTQEEADAYSLETGKGYRQMLLRYGQRALQMPTERARAFLSDKADEVRDRALKKVYRR